MTGRRLALEACYVAIMRKQGCGIVDSMVRCIAAVRMDCKVINIHTQIITVWPVQVIRSGPSGRGLGFKQCE